MSAKVHAAGSVEPPPLAKGILRLYSNRFCPYAYRVRSVLAAKNIPHEVVNIHLRSKPEWYLVINPEGKVPAIEFDGNIVYESLIIADYLDSVYPQPKLWSDDPLDVAKGRIIIERIGKLSAENIKAFQGDMDMQGIYNELEYFEKALNTLKKPYFSGEKPGMVDYMCWPFVEMGINIGDEKGIMSKKDRPLLTSWIEKMQNDATIKKACMDKELFKRFFLSMKSEKPDFDIGLTD